MVYLINKITQISMLVLIFLVIVAFGVFVYYIMTKNKRAKRSINEEDTVKVAFERKDARDYVKHIEDICDDMIVTDGGKRFVAALICSGFDFAFETAERQLATVGGMYAFSNTITKPVSYRQYSKPVDLEYTLKRHAKTLEERNEELFHVQEDIRNMEMNLKRDKLRLSEAEVALYKQEIRFAKKQEKALQFRCLHLQDEIRAITRYTGSRVDPETIETWIFEWLYDPYDFSYDMKAEEIHYRAVKELFSIGQTKMHALANCGVRARRATTEELIEMCRWYSSPVSSERYKLSDIKESSFFDDVTASDPQSAARKRALREIKEASDIAYYEAVKEAYKNLENGGRDALGSVEPDGQSMPILKREVRQTPGLPATKEGMPRGEKTTTPIVKAGRRKPATGITAMECRHQKDDKQRPAEKRPAIPPSADKKTVPASGRIGSEYRPTVRAASVGGVAREAAGSDLIGED